MKNKLIVIEGLDGSGKSTQVELILNRLTKEGIENRHVKLPDYNDKSSTLVNMYLGGEFGKSAKDVNAYAASSFYAVDRVASYLRHWGADYINGKTIVCDRYATSNLIYQMSKLPQNQWEAYIDWVHDFEYNKLGLPKPDLVIYLDMPVEISQKLMTKRYNGDENKKDIHEDNVKFLLECRKSALFSAEKCGWKVISCANSNEPRTIEDIHEQLYSLIKGVF